MIHPSELSMKDLYYIRKIVYQKLSKLEMNEITRKKYMDYVNEINREIAKREQTKLEV